MLHQGRPKVKSTRNCSFKLGGWGNESTQINKGKQRLCGERTEKKTQSPEVSEQKKWENLVLCKTKEEKAGQMHAGEWVEEKFGRWGTKQKEGNKLPNKRLVRSWKIRLKGGERGLAT